MSASPLARATPPGPAPHARDAWNALTVTLRQCVTVATAAVPGFGGWPPAAQARLVAAILDAATRQGLGPIAP